MRELKPMSEISWKHQLKLELGLFLSGLQQTHMICINTETVQPDLASGLIPCLSRSVATAIL